MSRRGRYETHENAQPDPERSQFATDLLTSSVATTQPIGLVGRMGPVAGVRPRRVYFTDPNGMRWRVYDMSFGPPEAQPYEERHYAPPYPPAKARLFVAANGDCRSFSFSDRHAHDGIKRPLLTAAIVSAQFRFAGRPSPTLEEELDARRDWTVLPASKWTPNEHHHLRRNTSTLNRWTAFDAD